MATQLNSSVSKGFAILKLFLKGVNTVCASDLVRELGMNGITAHRFLKSLEAEGALVQVRKGHFRPGYLLVELGDVALRQEDLGYALQPVLDAITADVHEASMATLFHDGIVICIARAMGPRSLSVDVRVGSRLEAYCTAHGKLWLAHLPAPQLERYLHTATMERKTRRTIVDTQGLLCELEAVRTRGYALNSGEREDGITAVAVPVLTRTDRMAVGLSVFGPSTRMGEAVQHKALARLQLAVEEARTILYGTITEPV